MAKKLLVFGFLLVLLLAIPLTMYVVQRQTNTKSGASASTKLFFSVDQTSLAPLTTPLNKNIGDIIPLPVVVSPKDGNKITLMHIVITFDGSKLTPAAVTDITCGDGAPSSTTPPFCIGTLDGSQQFDVLSVPTTTGNCSNTAVPPADTTCTVDLTLSTASLGQSASIQSATRVGTLFLKAIAATTVTSTPVSFSKDVTVLNSAGDQEHSGDNSLDITSADGITNAAINISTATPTPTGSGTPTPTGGNGATNQAPICTSFTADATASDSAPFSVLFTAGGNDPDSTISKVTFNFGDTNGSVQDVTDADGLGTGSINAQLSHIYHSNGTFTASATLTDNQGLTSNATACKQTITVGASTTDITPTPTQAQTAAEDTATPTPAEIASGDTVAPTIEKPGPAATIFGAGLFGTALAIIGGLLFLGL